MSVFGTMRRSSAFALLPVLLLAAALVLGVDGMKILPQTTSAGAVTKYLRAAIASYKDPLQLSAALDKAMPDLRVKSAQPLCERLSMQGASSIAAVQGERALKDSQWSSKTLRSNAVQLTINHEPISGVTGEMLVWAWSNPDMMVTAPGDDKEQQMYLLMHPIDHVSATPSETPIKVVPDAPWTGTVWAFQSYFGAGCTPELDVSGRWSVSCSPSSAFSCASDSSLYKVPSYDNTRHRGKGSTKNPTGVFFASLEPTNITLVAMWDGFKAWTLSHALTEEAGQLSCTTTYVFGTDGLLGRATNRIALSKTLAADMGGNFQQILPFFAVHEVQEFSFYPSWLPAVYEAYHAAAEPADSLAP